VTGDLFGTTASFAEVAVPVPVRHSFTYAVPEKLVGQLAPGSRVAVQFGPRKLPAFVVALTTTPPAHGRSRRAGTRAAPRSAPARDRASLR
jgi:primosomal protein N'